MSSSKGDFTSNPRIIFKYGSLAKIFTFTRLVDGQRDAKCQCNKIFKNYKAERIVSHALECDEIDEVLALELRDRKSVV